MADQLPKGVAERIKMDASKALPNDKLDNIRKHAIYMREAEEAVKDLTETLEEKTSALNLLKTKTLPEMMEDAGVVKLSIEAEGNHQAFDIAIKPKYIASIPKDLDPEKREEAFAELSALGGGDLIKTTVSFSFPKDSEEEVTEFIKLISSLSGKGFDWPDPQVEMTVHHASYSSWLREEYETCVKAGRPLPNLAKLNAMVIRLAELKFKKEKK